MRKLNSISDIKSKMLDTVSGCSLNKIPLSGEVAAQICNLPGATPEIVRIVNVMACGVYEPHRLVILMRFIRDLDIVEFREYTVDSVFSTIEKAMFLFSSMYMDPNIRGVLESYTKTKIRSYFSMIDNDTVGERADEVDKFVHIMATLMGLFEAHEAAIVAISATPGTTSNME